MTIKPRYSKCTIKSTGVEEEMKNSLTKFNEAYQADSKMRLNEARRILQATQAQLARKDLSHADDGEVKLNAANLSLSEAREQVKRTMQQISEDRLQEQGPKLTTEQQSVLEEAQTKRASDRATKRARVFKF